MTMCSRAVFRCFKFLERLADRVTGAAGPLFVGLAIILLSSGVVSFFDVIQPTLHWQILTIPLDALVAINLVGQYYLACTVSPGFIDDPPRLEGKGWMWAKKRSEAYGLIGGGGGIGWQMTRSEVTKCKKCGLMRPERAHHCRICDRCVLKYDHHCPVRINQCVGVYNERHFVLFMAYLILATLFVVILGYDKMWEALGFTLVFWPHHVPAILFALVYILSLVLCLAVGVMCLWHLWSITKGETSVETFDHDVYRKMAKERGEAFVNSFDLGKLKNLQLFFNVTETGYPYYTLFFPFRIPPYTDGRSWARREGYDRHKGIRPGEELTDEEEEEEDEE